MFINNDENCLTFNRLMVKHPQQGQCRANLCEVSVRAGHLAGLIWDLLQTQSLRLLQTHFMVFKSLNSGQDHE